MLVLNVGNTHRDPYLEADIFDEIFVFDIALLCLLPLLSWL